MRNAIFDPVFVKEKQNPPDARFGGARTCTFVGIGSPHLCLSAVVPAYAEPDIHSLSQVPKDCHKRLSGRTLPVLKQCGESLGSLITVAESATSRTN